MLTKTIRRRHPLRVFIAVIRALFLREIEMRISSGKWGLFWTFFEPFFQILAFVLIKVMIMNHTGKASATSFEWSVFMASGFIGFNLFRRILTSSSGAFQANKALFFYRQVKPIDTIFSRALVELFLAAVITVLFLIIGFVLNVENLLPQNTVMVFSAYLWLMFFAIGVGILVAVGNTFVDSIGKIISLLSFALLILSGVFYPLVTLPSGVRDTLLHNPLVHFMEMIHGAYIYGLDDRFVDYQYILMWTIIPFFIGMWLYNKMEKRIISE